MNRQKGIILATLLIFILIFSLLAIEGLQTSNMEWSMARNWKEEQVTLAKAEYSLKLSEATIGEPISQTCIHLPLSELALQNLDKQQWMSSKTCVNTLQDHYIIEFLGSDPCSGLSGIDYYRITLKAQGSDNAGIVYLQSTYAKPSATPRACLENKRREFEEVGRLSWRML